MEENKMFKWPFIGVKEHTKSYLALNRCLYFFMSVADQLNRNFLDLGSI